MLRSFSTLFSSHKIQKTIATENNNKRIATKGITNLKRQTKY